LAVVFHVQFCGFAGVVGGSLVVAMSGVGVMRRFFMVAGFVVGCSFFVMACGMLVMLRSLVVMLGSFLRHRNSS
jgi:hypothetical protein